MNRRKAFRYPRYKVLVALFAIAIALSGCNNASTEIPASAHASGSPSNSAQQSGFIVKEVPVFRVGPTDERATLRFYDDMPNVAYISVTDFYKLLLPQGTMDATMQDDGTWLLVSHTGAKESETMEHGAGGTAVVDPVAGTISSPDLPAFVNTMSLSQDGIDNVYLDSAGFVRVSSVEYDKPADPVCIDFGKYGIVARGDDDGLWLPVHTLSAFFTNLRYDFIIFNGQKLYVNSDNILRPLTERDPEFGDAFFAQAERPDDMVSFDYAQLCLAFDNFYGKPACAPEVLKTQGLDAYLTSLGDSGKAIKDALMSKDYAQFLHGCDGLNSVVNVDAHTELDIAKSLGLDKSKAHEDLYQRYMALGANTDDPVNKLVAEHAEEVLPVNAIQLYCKELSRRAFGDSTYAKKGDTAVIVLDSFNDIDFTGWKSFLEGNGPRPSGTEPISDESSPSRGNVDSLAIFLDGLNKAKADPEVKNVIIDVSKNDGGSDDVVIFITSLIANCESERFQNTRTGQTIIERFDVDRNLDGEFNDKDALVDNSGLRYAVLTSSFSFSCANMFPSILKDAGIPILGERSRGGSCSVQKQIMGNGAVYMHSSWLSRVINDAGEDVDTGIPVDVDLLERAGAKKELREVNSGGQILEAELYDYSSFYDIDNLSQVMNELYGSDL